MEPETKEMKVGSVASAGSQPPLIYIDGIQGMFITAGVLGGQVKMNLFADVQPLTLDDQDAPLERQVVARLIMTPQTLISIYDWMGPKIEGLKAAIAEAQAKHGG